MEPALDDKVVLRNIPFGLSRERLLIHFQQTKNGGGDVQSLVFPVSGMPPDSAVIKFYDAPTVQSVLKRKHHVTRKNIDVQVENFRPGIFDEVRVETNKQVLDKISDDVLNDLQEETGVKLNDRTSEVEGEWYQIRTFAEGLECLQNRSFDNNNFNADALTPEKTPDTSTDINEVEIKLDKDVFAYMRLIECALVDNIINQYNVELKEENDGAIIAKFKGQLAEEGINDMQKLYEEAHGKLVQINHDLPSSIADSEVQEILQKVQEYSKDSVIVSKMPDQPVVMFIGSSKEECQRAVQLMKALDGSSLQYSSPVSSSISNRGHNPEKLFEFKFPNTGLKIQVIHGDIAAQHADAIVNAANSELRDGAGVTGAIFRAGGHYFRERCEDLMQARKYKELGLGEIVHVPACGGLKCSWVLHAVGPKWWKLPEKNRKSECRKVTTRVLNNLISYATHTLMCCSISIPAIGTGIYGVPLDVFCDAMLDVIHLHQSDLSKPSSKPALLDIRLVNFNHYEASEIAFHFKKRFAQPHESAV